MQQEILEKQLAELTSQLIREQNSDGFWTGRLASSALSTAVALVVLKLDKESNNDTQIASGLQWLHDNVNEDGGFGDTPESASNVSSSLLCYAALSFCLVNEKDNQPVLKGIENYLAVQGISFTTQNLTSSVLKYYGKDFTFSVPILSMLALCEVLTDDVYQIYSTTTFRIHTVTGFIIQVLQPAGRQLCRACSGCCRDLYFQKKEKAQPVQQILQNQMHCSGNEKAHRNAS